MKKPDPGVCTSLPNGLAAPLTPEQQAELDQRLDAYEADGNPGRPAMDVIAEIRKKL